MRALFHFFIYSNIFIALCSVVMVNQTTQLLFHLPPDNRFLGFVFSATICSYSFHWYLTTLPGKSSSRFDWLKQYKIFHVVLFFAGLIASVVFFYFFLPFWPWIFFSVFLTFLYSAPKIPHPLFKTLLNVAIGKTIFLALVWTYVTTMLPIVIMGNTWTTPMILFCVGRFFFVYAICIMFDYRDREEDKAEGIKSMITYFSEKGVNYLFFTSLVIFAITTLLLLNYGFSILQVSILLLPAAITALIYQNAKKNFSDLLYYFVLDGLMMLSAFLMLLIN